MRFNYHQPNSLQEALEILAREEDARLLAGGTDLLVYIQDGLANPAKLVDIGGLEELKEIVEEDGRIAVGALVTHAEAAASPLIREKALALAEGCAEVGSPQIRNRGTIGGNLANASPSADSAPPLYVLGAALKLQSLQGEREVPIEDFLVGVKKSVLRPDEIIVRVTFPPLSPTARGFFRKLGQRKALAIAKVSVAGTVDLREKTVASVRLALGAVATTPLRAIVTESYLEGRELDKKTIAEAARLIREESKAISDIRSTADYRDEMTGTLLARALEEIAGEL